MVISKKSFCSSFSKGGGGGGPVRPGHNQSFDYLKQPYKRPLFESVTKSSRIGVYTVPFKNGTVTVQNSFAFKAGSELFRIAEQNRLGSVLSRFQTCTGQCKRGLGWEKCLHGDATDRL